MMRCSFTAILTVLITCIFSCSTDGRIPGSTFSEGDQQCNNIRSYLAQEASKISDGTADQPTTLGEWEKMRPVQYRQFLEMMGIDQLTASNNRSPLNVKITGSIQKKGYRIEKLYFESLPGLYVRANLYIPDSIASPRPTILYVSGHARDQKTAYQDHPQKFAQLGFVCMLTETIQFGEVLGEHWGCYARGWFNWYSRGYDPGGVELWNAIRALDVLSQRTEVDTAKMGVTGISGGGSQTWYIAAADPRIKAAAPVCGAGTLKDHIINRTVDGHCDCMMPLNTYQRDFRNIGALIAPRPLLIAQSDQDGMFKIEAVRELEKEVKKTYTLYGKPQQVSLVETPGGHSYHKISRENIFSFFVEHLMNKKLSPEQVGDIDTDEDSKTSSEELRVYVNGPPADDRTTTIQNSFIPLPGPPSLQAEKDLYAYRDSVKHFLKEKTFGAFPKAEAAFDQKHEFKSSASENSGSSIYSFISEEGWRLKVEVHWKGNPDTKKPLMVVLRNYNEERWSAESFLSELSDEWNVAIFEPRGVGETGWDPGLQWHIRRAAAWTGRTIASMQVYDALRCLQFCRGLPNVDSTRTGIAAQNEMGAVALYAALLDGHCQTVALKDPPPTQDAASNPDGKGPAIEMLNCLKITDVNQLPALLYPAKIMFRGTVPTTYQWAENTLKQIGGAGFATLRP